MAGVALFSSVAIRQAHLVRQNRCDCGWSNRLFSSRRGAERGNRSRRPPPPQRRDRNYTRTEHHALPPRLNLSTALEPFLHEALIHSRLDSALSKVPTKRGKGNVRGGRNLKNELAVASSLILRRPDLFSSRRTGLPWASFPLGDDHNNKQVLNECHAWITHATETAIQYLDANPTNNLTDKEHGDNAQHAPPFGGFEAAFPHYMILEWQEAWGTAKAAELARTLGTQAPTSVRVGRKQDLPMVARSLSRDLGDSSTVRRCRTSPVGLLCNDSPARIMTCAAYKEGLCAIQDEGSQLLAMFALWPGHFSSLLNESPGTATSSDIIRPFVNHGKNGSSLQSLPRWSSKKNLKVVDACAGAGGKSLAMADFLGGQGKVFAYDIYPWKLARLRQRAKIAPDLRNIQTITVPDVAGEELSVIPSKHLASADIVLVDAPCSGWGTLRRTPDIKFRQTAIERKRLEELQLRLLRVYSELVRPGGRLVFGTCTFRPQETRDISSQFLDCDSGADFSAGPAGYFGPSPDSDGFFMASFTKHE